MNYAECFYSLKQALSALYDEGETVAIAHEVLSHITGYERMERLMRKDELFTANQVDEFERVRAKLLTGMPLQQVLGYAWFMGMKLKVDGNVLIPRPETEELVQWVVDDYKHTTAELSVLDIGTGSGCIPIALAKQLPTAKVEACDISPAALSIATENATAHGVSVLFREVNILDIAASTSLPQYDIIISNPPYIPVSERLTMDKNVADFDPELALFVPDEDPLLFYKAIAAFGKLHLKEGGRVYCEIHQDSPQETAAMFKAQGYEVTLRKDNYDNYRMVLAC